MVGPVSCNVSTAYRGEILQPPSAHATSLDATESLRDRLLSSADPYLKCHFWDGSLIVLQDWRVEDETVTGTGIKYDSRREVVEQAQFHVPISSVALFETNRPEAIKSARLPVMATVAATSVALTALCITTPKACFGSCPTIYASNGSDEVLQAEGFSSSVARALESTDVDALADVPARWEAPELRVANEAPETHAIRSLALLYAPRPPEGRVYRDAERYYACGPTLAPSRCSAESGDCLPAVTRADATEYRSLTDGVDLAAKEELQLEFDQVPKGELGLVLTARNTVLSTYLSYQTLAYMGSSWGEYLAFIERSSEATLRKTRAIIETLGGVAVQVDQGGDKWTTVGEYSEAGPLARETVVVKLTSTQGNRTRKGRLRVRLVMTRGNMRLDRVGLVPILEEVWPTRLQPMQVLQQRQPDPEALARLLDPERYLVTYPSDEYTVKFPDPRCDDCEWFVESRGYYYTWMRDAWLPERDPAKLAQLLVAPNRTLRDLAPAYQAIEPVIDQLFWQSRVSGRGSARNR